MSAPLTRARLDALLALADAATPGPWLADRNCVYVQPGAVRWWIANTNTIRGASGYYASPIAEAETEAGLAPKRGDEDDDAALIAACDPDTVRALVRIALAAGELAESGRNYEAGEKIPTLVAVRINALLRAIDDAAGVPK